MHYTLLIHAPEPQPGEVPDEAFAEMEQAFGTYLTALHEAGVLLGAEMLLPQHDSTTVSRRTGATQVQDGPFAETKEALAGVFILDVTDLDAALAWAEKCPAASYGTVEVRPVAISGHGGVWSTPDCPARPA